MFNDTYVYVRCIQVSGRQSITAIVGLDEELNLKKILRAMKRSMSCNGTVKDGIIQLQGDHRTDAARWLVSHEIVDANVLMVG